MNFLTVPFYVLVLLLGLAIPFVNAIGGEEPENTESRIQLAQQLIITGKISVKGNMPHTFLCLTTDNRIDYKLIGAQKEYISNYLQQKTVTLRGVVTKDQIGPGFPAEFEVIKILKEPPSDRFTN